MKPYYLFIFILAFYGCSSNSKLSSTFGERKYTKGYFWDIPAASPTGTANSNIIITKTAVSINAISPKNIPAPTAIHPIRQLEKLTVVKHLQAHTLQKLETTHSTIEHVSMVQIAAPTDEATDEDNGSKKTEGIILFFVGIILLACGYLLSLYISSTVISGAAIIAILLVIPMVLLLIAGLVLFISGLVYWVKYSKHKNL